MSDKRDLIHYEWDATVHFAATLAAGSFMVTSVPANSYIHEGPEVMDSHIRLKGLVEHLDIKLKQVTAVPMEIVFFNQATANETVIANDAYIDHESIVADDFFEITEDAATVHRTAKSGLAIPYYDLDKSKKFHIGIKNSGATAIAADALVLGWGWRPDLGGG